MRPTAERVRELLDYDPETGVFRWRVTRGPMRAGSVAGHLNEQGYIVIAIGRYPYGAHRLAFVCVTGEWPKQQVDHVNGNKAENRFCNLRDVSASTNQQNRRSASKGKSAPLGVYLINGRWCAQIKLAGRLKYLGNAPTPEAAHELYVLAKRQLHAGCTL